jgi:hypothetical protein
MGDDGGTSRDGRTASRRRIPDRRARPTPMLSRYTFVGRRRAARRAGESRSIYVDRPGARAYGVLAAVLLLSGLDALFTLMHLGRGGREANPLMEWAIGLGPVTFLLVKCALTGTGALLLVLHRTFRGVGALLGAVLLLYCGLMGYHVYLAIALRSYGLP